MVKCDVGSRVNTEVFSCSKSIIIVPSNPARKQNKLPTIRVSCTCTPPPLTPPTDFIKYMEIWILYTNHYSCLYDFTCSSIWHVLRCLFNLSVVWDRQLISLFLCSHVMNCYYIYSIGGELCWLYIHLFCRFHSKILSCWGNCDPGC